MATTPNIAELVERMPATDREIEALKPPPPPDPAADPTKPKPKPKPPTPGSGSKFTAPDPNVVEKICDEIIGGGPASFRELIGLIRDPAAEDYKNYKAEYLCHCLTIYLGRPEKQPQRSAFIGTLAAETGNEKLPLHTRGFLARELQLIGDRAAVSALGQLLTDEKLCDDATRALLSINDNVAGEFRVALPKVQGRSRLIILQALGVLRDAQSVAAFQKAAADADTDIRLAAVWGLARVGDAGSVDLLLKTADTQAPWERIKATQACLLLAEALAAAGKKAESARIYTHLRDTRTDPKEKYIRDAAAKAL